MKSFLYCCLAGIMALAASCKTSSRLTARDDGKLELVLVQVNDVYEIAPLSGGKSGGVARVATIKKQYKKSNPNTFLVIAGDFVSPSVFNSLKDGDTPIRGKQMVDALNGAGMDLAIFGNHEFDIKEAELQERLNESHFQWVASNAFHKTGGQMKPFEKTTSDSTVKIPLYYIKSLTDADGTSVKIGFIGLTIPSNPADYVGYTEPLQAANEVYNIIKDSCDAVVAITHLPLKDDMELAKQLPELAAILGGHEHDMHIEKIGNVFITKAHANAKSAYVVKLSINKKNKSVRAAPELKMLDEAVGLDSATNNIVSKWMDIGDHNYASLGFDPKQVLIAKGDTLDGLETDVRASVTNLTDMISAAIAEAHPLADAIIYNAGSIRLDDKLPPPVTQYDIIRTLPFGGNIIEADVNGKLLTRMLEEGRKNSGSGGFLQCRFIRFDSGNNTYQIRDQPVDPTKSYRIAMLDFLLTGRETNLEFLTKDNPGVLKIYDPGGNSTDMRLAVVRYLQKKNMQ